MQKLLTSAFVAFMIVATPATTFAATVKTQAASKKVYAASRAEGADIAGARATAWKGTIIGINDGARGFIITEATQLNHIKAFSQRYIQITSDTVITNDEDVKDYGDIDIGYRIEVKGTYNAKQRIITATSIEILQIPAVPVTRTK